MSRSSTRSRPPRRDSRSVDQVMRSLRQSRVRAGVTMASTRRSCGSVGTMLEDFVVVQQEDLWPVARGRTRSYQPPPRPRRSPRGVPARPGHRTSWARAIASAGSGSPIGSGMSRGPRLSCVSSRWTAQAGSFHAPAREAGSSTSTPRPAQRAYEVEGVGLAAGGEIGRHAARAGHIDQIDDQSGPFAIVVRPLEGRAGASGGSDCRSKGALRGGRLSVLGHGGHRTRAAVLRRISNDTGSSIWRRGGCSPAASWTANAAA